MEDLPLHVGFEVLYECATRQELDGHLSWRRAIWIQRADHAPKGALPQHASLQHNRTQLQYYALEVLLSHVSTANQHPSILAEPQQPSPVCISRG